MAFQRKSLPTPGYTLASYNRDPYWISGDFKWDLWWMRGHCSKFFSSSSVFPSSSPFYRCSTPIYHLPTTCVVALTKQHTIIPLALSYGIHPGSAADWTWGKHNLLHDGLQVSTFSHMMWATQKFILCGDVSTLLKMCTSKSVCTGQEISREFTHLPSRVSVLTLCTLCKEVTIMKTCWNSTCCFTHLVWNLLSLCLRN